MAQGDSPVLTESQVQELEKRKLEKQVEGEIETEHPGYLGCQDTYYVGTIKGVGRIYQQTFIDSYSKVAMAKLYDRKNALVAADMLNYKVVPWFEEEGIRLLMILTDRGTEYCGNREHHEFQLFLALEDIDHSKTKARLLSPTVFVNNFTEPFKTNFMRSLLGRRYTTRLKICKRIWISGSIRITTNVRIKASIVFVKPRYRLSLTRRN